jgi:hypothetical protein
MLDVIIMDNNNGVDSFIVGPFNTPNWNKVLNQAPEKFIPNKAEQEEIQK